MALRISAAALHDMWHSVVHDPAQWVANILRKQGITVADPEPEPEEPATPAECVDPNQQTFDLVVSGGGCR